MLNLKIGFCAILISISLPLCAQQLPWPTDPQGKPYRLDYQYGARYIENDGSFFHKGIDLNERETSENEDINHPIVAAANGTIFGIGRTSQGLHWIGVDYGNGRTFSYLHVFPDNAPEISGDFSDVLINTIANNNQIISYRRIVAQNTNCSVQSRLKLSIRQIC